MNHKHVELRERREAHSDESWRMFADEFAEAYGIDRLHFPARYAVRFAITITEFYGQKAVVILYEDGEFNNKGCGAKTGAVKAFIFTNTGMEGITLCDRRTPDTDWGAIKTYATDLMEETGLNEKAAYEEALHMQNSLNELAFDEWYNEWVTTLRK